MCSGKLIYQWGDLPLPGHLSTYLPHSSPVSALALRTHTDFIQCALQATDELDPSIPLHPSSHLKAEALFLWQLLFITTVATHIWTILPMPGEQFESTPVNQLYIGSYSRVESGIL